jgi:F-type H+-transporting ATPase subunit epsilon
MKLTIVSPEKILFQGEATSVTVPGTKGQFEVLDNHAPIISSLQKGTLSYKADEEVNLEISGGFIDVANNQVAICIEL